MPGAEVHFIFTVNLQAVFSTNYDMNHRFQKMYN